VFIVIAMPECPDTPMTTLGEAPDAIRNERQEWRRSCGRTVGVKVLRPSSSSATSTRTRARISSERKDRFRLRGCTRPFRNA
jgi:hypothetical protein